MTEPVYKVQELAWSEFVRRLGQSVKQQTGVSLELYMDSYEENEFEMYIDNVSFERKEMESLVSLGIYEDHVLNTGISDEFNCGDVMDYLVGPNQVFQLLSNLTFGTGTKVSGKDTLMVMIPA